MEKSKWIAMPMLALVGGMAIVLSMGAVDSSNPAIAVMAWIGAVLGAVVFTLAAWALASRLTSNVAVRSARLGLVTVLAHIMVLLGHDHAHDELGVGLSALQVAFVFPVILLAPMVAAVLLYTRWAHRGAILLGASMAGALLFGVYWHYMANSPDHVAHLPAGDAQALFRLTALGLAMVEVLGVAAGLWAWRQLRRTGGEAA